MILCGFTVISLLRCLQKLKDFVVSEQPDVAPLAAAAALALAVSSSISYSAAVIGDVSEDATVFGGNAVADEVELPPPTVAAPLQVVISAANEPARIKKKATTRRLHLDQFIIDGQQENESAVRGNNFSNAAEYYQAQELDYDDSVLPDSGSDTMCDTLDIQCEVIQYMCSYYLIRLLIIQMCFPYAALPHLYDIECSHDDQKTVLVLLQLDPRFTASQLHQVFKYTQFVTIATFHYINWTLFGGFSLFYIQLHSCYSYQQSKCGDCAGSCGSTGPGNPCPSVAADPECRSLRVGPVFLVATGSPSEA